MLVRSEIRAERAKLGFWRPERRSLHRLAAFGPSAKSVGRPLFLSYQFSPTFSHSPHSALGGRAEAAKLVPGGSSTALGNKSARSEPLQKVSAAGASDEFCGAMRAFHWGVARARAFARAN